MLKIITSEYKHEHIPTTIEFSGDPFNVASELGVAVRAIYGLWKDHDSQKADCFRDFIQILFTDPDTPVWKSMPGLQVCIKAGGSDEND